MSMSVLPARIYMHHVCASCSQRAEQGVRFLKLELWMAVSHHEGAGNGIQVLKSSLPLSHLNSSQVKDC